MHRWTVLRRQQQHSSSSLFPVSFFTAASYSYAHRSAAAAFSDSSRSRPPRKSGPGNGGGAGGPAAAATATTTANKSETASTSTTTASTDSDGTVKTRDSVAAATSPSSNGTSSTTRGRSSRNQGNTRSSSTTQGTPTHSHSHTWTPQTFIPLPFLHAHPAQITQDAFYAGHRPLLQVSVPKQSRQSPSAKDRKVLDIVGGGEVQAKAEAEGPAGTPWFDEDEPGQWDAYLVTEPEGSDPRWGEVAEHYLAGLQHHVAPPVPSSSPSTSSSSASPSSRKPPSPRRQNIDYLFPIQAEQRALEEQARKYAEEANITQPARLPESKLKPYRPHSGSNSFHPESVNTTSGDLHSNTAGVRFLLSHLVKNQWSGMWDFERVAKALQAALSKLEKKRAVKVVAAAEKGGPAPDAAPKVKSTASTSKSLDELSSASRHQARLRAKAAKRVGAGSSKGGGRKGSLERMLTEALEESGARIAVFPFNEDGQPVRLSGAGSGMAVNGQTAEEGRTRRPTMSREEREAFKQEVERVVNQVNRFQGFFDKSVELDKEASEKGKSSSSATASDARSAADAALERLDARFGARRVGSSSSAYQPEDGEAIVSVEVSFNSPSSSSSSATRIVDDPSELDWVSSSLPSQEDIDARHNSSSIALGPRLSQSVRGRSLRPTLRDRLSMRGVGLEETGPVGEEHLPVFFDSVKRKRRKRISKHKYKKRRKANRAERRRTGK